MPVGDPPRSSFLNFLQHVYVVLVVRVPYRACVFEDGADEGLVRQLFHSLVCCPEISAKEAKGLVCLVSDVGDMLLPS